MDEELEIESVDVGAGVALAGSVHHHKIDRPLEGDIGLLDHLNEGLALEPI